MLAKGRNTQCTQSDKGSRVQLILRREILGSSKTTGPLVADAIVWEIMTARIVPITSSKYPTKRPERWRLSRLGGSRTNLGCEVTCLASASLQVHSWSTSRLQSLSSGLESSVFAANAHRIRRVSPQEELPIAKVASTFLYKSVMTFPIDHQSVRTTQQKHSACQSCPMALTTTSVTGFLHFLHLGLYLFVWQPRHHAYPSFSTKGVLESKG